MQDNLQDNQVRSPPAQWSEMLMGGKCVVSPPKWNHKSFLQVTTCELHLQANIVPNFWYYLLLTTYKLKNYCRYISNYFRPRHAKSIPWSRGIVSPSNSWSTVYAAQYSRGKTVDELHPVAVATYFTTRRSDLCGKDLKVQPVGGRYMNIYLYILHNYGIYTIHMIVCVYIYI